MAEYSYSKILTGIRTKLEEEFQDEMSKIDFNKLAIKALKEKGIDLASLVDINQDVLIDILGEAVSRALQSDKWKSKIHRQNVDISDLIDLNGKDLDDKIKEYYDGMQKAFDKGDEQLAKSMRDSFMKAMMFSNQRNAWITNYLNDEHFEKVIGKYYDDMQKAIDKGDKQLAKSINQKIKLNESRHDWALEYQDLLTQRNSDFKLDKDEDVIIDNKKIEKGLTESAQKYQKWTVDIGHQFQELKEQAQGVGQEISNSVSNGIANQQKKVEKSLKDMIGKDQLEIVDQARNIIRNMSDIGLTADQMREKLRLEAEEIKKGNMAFQERITLLKNNVVVDSFIGNGKSTSFDRNLLLSKEYDFLMHTHPDNEPGAYNFGNYDVGNFVFDKEFTSIFKKAELITNGITQVILDFANMTSEQIQQFSFLYDDAEHTVRAAFGKMQEDGRIDLHGADYKEVSKYLNALGDFLIKDLGGNLQYFQKGALDPDRFKQIYDEFLQAHELLEVIDLNNGSALDDIVKSQRKVVAQAMYDNFHNSGKEIVDAMVNEATQRAEEVKQASIESAKILNEAVQDGIAEGTDSHSPSKEAEKQADNVVDGFVQEIDQRLPEVEKVGEKIGESVKDGIKESIKDLPSSEDDIEAYLAQLDAKVGLETKPQTEGLNEAQKRYNEELEFTQQQLVHLKDDVKAWDKKGIVSKYLFGEDGNVKSAEQMLAEIKTETDKVFKKFNTDFEKGIIHNDDDYLKALENTMRKIKVGTAYGILNNKNFSTDINDYLINSATNMYHKWTKKDSKWGESFDTLDDATLSAYGYIIEYQEKLNLLQQDGGQAYTEYIEKVLDLYHQIQDTKQKYATFDTGLDVKSLDITQEEADNRAKALHEQAQAIEELTTETQEYVDAHKEFQDFSNVPYLKNDIQGLQTLSQIMDDQATKFELYTKQRRTDQFDIFSKATDYKLAKKTGYTDEIERTWENLEDVIYAGSLQGQEAIKQFDQKTKELGYTFDDVTKKWQKIQDETETKIISLAKAQQEIVEPDIRTEYEKTVDAINELGEEYEDSAEYANQLLAVIDRIREIQTTGKLSYPEELNDLKIQYPELNGFDFNDENFMDKFFDLLETLPKAQEFLKMQNIFDDFVDYDNRVNNAQGITYLDKELNNINNIMQEATGSAQDFIVKYKEIVQIMQSGQIDSYETIGMMLQKEFHDFKVMATPEGFQLIPKTMREISEETEKTESKIISLSDRIKRQLMPDVFQKNENSISNSEVAPVSEEIVTTEQQLAEETAKANTVIEEQKQKIAELESQVNDLESSLRAQSDELQHAYEEQGDLQSQLDREKGASGYLEETLREQQQISEELQNQNEELKKQNDFLKEDNDYLQSEKTFLEGVKEELQTSVEDERQARKEAEVRADTYEEISRIAARSEAEADEKMRLEVEARHEAEKQLDIKKEENEELKKKLDLTEQIVNESKTKETKVDSEEVSNIKAVQNAIKKKNNAFKTEEKTVDKSVTNEINKLKELEKVISENIPNAINKKDSAFIGEKEIVKQVVDEEKKAIKQPASKTTTEKAKPVSNDSLIKAYNIQFAKLKKAVTNDKNIITDEIKEFYETLSGKDIKLESSDAIKQYTENIKQFLDTIEKRGNETKLLKNINDATSTLQKNSAMPKRLAKDYQQLIDEMKAMSKAGGYTNKQVSEMTNRLIKLDTELARTGKSGRSFFNMIANDIKTSSARMIAMYFSFQDLIRYARSAVQAVTQLDTALTQLRVVSNASEAELRRVANSAYEMANALGSSTTEITNSITEWRRLGYTIEESQKLAEAAAKLSTGGLMDVNSATTSLISSMQAFKDMGIEAEDIVDQYIYLGNNFAISSQELATSLTKSMAALKVAGNSLEEIEALEVAGNTIVQEADTVSNSLKVNLCLHIWKHICYVRLNVDNNYIG